MGQLLGSIFVLFTDALVPTPIPFLRFDSLTLLVIWALPAYSDKIQPHNAAYAWCIAAILIPISTGWAAGDISILAFIQASLARMESADPQVSALGSVIAFLYSAYIIIYAILGSVLGTYIDEVFAKDGNIYRVLVNLGGVQVSPVTSLYSSPLLSVG